MRRKSESPLQGCFLIYALFSFPHLKHYVMKKIEWLGKNLTRNQMKTVNGGNAMNVFCHFILCQIVCDLQDKNCNGATCKCV